MDIVGLLTEAKAAGVVVDVRNGDLRIEAERSQETLVRRLQSFKREIVAYSEGGEPPADAELAQTNGKDGPRLSFRDVAEFLDEEFEVRWWVDQVFKRDVPTTIFGPSKSLKTSIAIDLAISIATGGRYLGEFPILTPGKVGYISGEIIDADLQTLLRAVSEAKGVLRDDIRGRMVVETTVPSFGHPLWRDALVEAIEGAELDIVFIDPTYFAMADADASQLGDVGVRLQAIRDAVAPTGCQLVLIHHSSKAFARPTREFPDINDMTGAGYAEWTRQWIGVNRRVAYDHDNNPGWHQLNCNIGSFRAGWSGILEINEGTSREPGWDVSTCRRSEVLEQEARAKTKESEKEEAHLEFEIRCLLRADPERWFTLSDILSEVSGGRDRVKRILHSLTKDMRIEQSETEVSIRGGKSRPWRSLEQPASEPEST